MLYIALSSSNFPSPLDCPVLLSGLSPNSPLEARRKKTRQKPGMHRGPDRDLTFVELHYPNLKPRPHRGGHEKRVVGFFWGGQINSLLHCPLLLIGSSLRIVFLSLQPDLPKYLTL